MTKKSNKSGSNPEFSCRTRARNIQRLKEETFDLIIVGGGVTGAGIAWEATLRGLKVGLVDKGDFASGTSSNSSKLIHGGLRYLRYLKLGLIYEASNERRILGTVAPHMVTPLLFVIPLYEDGPFRYIEIWAGLMLYDLLSRFTNVRSHEMIGAEETLNKEPSIKRDGMIGSALYYDRRTDDARLTLATIRSAFRRGAAVANYIAVNDFPKENGKVLGVHCADQIDSQEFTSRSRVVVNATGPWVDHVRRLDDPRCHPKLRLTKGVHLVVPRTRLKHRNAVVMTALRDERMIFAIPWGHNSIIGTTDTDYTGSLEEVGVTENDVRYLLESVNHHFPGTELTQEDIISAYAGLRPLIDGRATSEYDVPRDYEIFESDSGLVTIAGGKLTTYRSMAVKLVDHVIKRLREDHSVTSKKEIKSDKTPLEGGDIDDLNDFMENAREQIQEKHGLDAEVTRHLIEAYGTHYTDVLGFIGDELDGAQKLIPGLPYLRVEIPYAVEHEMTMTLSDFMIRRTHIIHQDRDQGIKTARDIAQTMSELLGWDAGQTEEQLQAYRDQVELTRNFRR